MDFLHPRRAQAIRNEIGKVAHTLINRNGQVHYAEVRPIPTHQRPLGLPLTTDCSGFATLCYCWGGARDPNGRGFDGLGFTGTLLTHGRRVRRLSRLRRGDLIIYGPAPGHHVVLVVEPGPDPLCASHGNEAGPILVRHSAEAAGQPPGWHGRRYRLL